LAERGRSINQPLLAIIDGSKALRKLVPAKAGGGKTDLWGGCHRPEMPRA